MKRSKKSPAIPNKEFNPMWIVTMRKEIHGAPNYQYCSGLC